MLPYTTPMTHEDQRKTLTPLQKRFVKEYPIDFNGTDAYLRASKTTNRKSASVQASKFMKWPKIKEAIEAYVQEQLGPHEQELLGNVKFWRGIRDNPEARAADRLKASEMLAKYQQMFVERREYDISGQVQIVDDIN
jgi:phage terminase small subunit